MPFSRVDRAGAAKLFAGCGVLAALLIFLEPTPCEIRIGGRTIDRCVQNRFYDFDAHRWLIDEHARIPKLLFYDGPKILIIALAVIAIAAAISPATLWARFRFARVFHDRRTAWFFIAVLALIPLACNRLKAVTNTYCPRETVSYGGHAPDVRLWDSYAPEFKTYQKEHHERGRGFPAGHASGGFALMSLGYLSERRSARIAGFAVGILAGWWMGAYQMMNGAHYLNHTLVTCTLAWIGVTLLAMLFHPYGYRRDHEAV